MKVFSGNPKAKEQGLGMIAKMMESKGMDAASRKKITEMLIGATAVGAGLYKSQDVDTTKLEREVSWGLSNLYGDLSNYFK